MSIQIPKTYNRQSVLEAQKQLATDLVDKLQNDPEFRDKFVNDPEGALKDADLLDDLAIFNATFQNVTTTQAKPDMVAAAEGDCSSGSSCCCVTGIY